MNHVSARAQILELLMAASKGLVDLPEHVSIEFEVSDEITVFKIDVHKDDRSNFMGKAGSNMRALRTLSDSLAQKADIRVVLILCE